MVYCYVTKRHNEVFFTLDNNGDISECWRETNKRIIRGWKVVRYPYKPTKEILGAVERIKARKRCKGCGFFYEDYDDPNDFTGPCCHWIGQTYIHYWNFPPCKGGENECPNPNID